MIRYEISPERVATNPELMQTQLVPSEEAEKVGLKMKRRGKEKIEITSPKDAVELIKGMEDYDREHVKVIYLDTRANIVGMRTATIGSLNLSIMDPSSIYKGALLANADSIITVHNHPSGDPMPSDGDVDVTQRIAQAGKLLGIGLRDHIIIGKDGYTSLREKGLISSNLLINPREAPEIKPGIRITYLDRDGKFRSNYVIKRWNNKLTVKDAQGKKCKAHLERVIGYWPPRVKASPKNFIKLNPMPKAMQIYNLAQELQRRGITPDLVDLEAEVDSILTYPENLANIMQQYAPTAPPTRLKTGDVAALEEKAKAEFCTSAERECSMGIEEACRAFEEYTCTTKPEPMERRRLAFRRPRYIPTYKPIARLRHGKQTYELVMMKGRPAIIS